MADFGTEPISPLSGVNLGKGLEQFTSGRCHLWAGLATLASRCVAEPNGRILHQVERHLHHVLALKK